MSESGPQRIPLHAFSATASNRSSDTSNSSVQSLGSADAPITWQLSKQLLSYIVATFSSFKRPGKGWIRTWRESHKLSGVELSKRLRVSPARVSVLERDEARLGVTLKTMQRVAEAMDCEFVYGFIPKQTKDQDGKMLPDSFASTLAEYSPDSDTSQSIQRLNAARWRE